MKGSPTIDQHIEELKKVGFDVRVHNTAFDDQGRKTDGAKAIFVREKNSKSKISLHDGEITDISLETFLEFYA
jgi:hypothetical protein